MSLTCSSLPTNCSSTDHKTGGLSKLSLPVRKWVSPAIIIVDICDNFYVCSSSSLCSTPVVARRDRRLLRRTRSTPTGVASDRRRVKRCRDGGASNARRPEELSVVDLPPPLPHGSALSSMVYKLSEQVESRKSQGASMGPFGASGSLDVPEPYK